MTSSQSSQQTTSSISPHPKTASHWNVTVSDSLLLIAIHVIAPLSRLATKRPDWPVSPTPKKCKKSSFYVPQPTFLFPLETPLRLSRNMLHGWKDHSVHAKPLAACAPATVSQLFEPQVPKIAVFTYRSPHFCFLWGRPWGNHAKYYMDGKIIRCLQIALLNVPI